MESTRTKAALHHDVYVCTCVCACRHDALLKLVPEAYIAELESKGEDLTLQGE